MLGYVNMLKFIITFISCFIISKAHRWETFLACEGGLHYCINLAPLCWEAHKLGLYPRLKFFKNISYPFKKRWHQNPLFGHIVNENLKNKK